MWRPFEGVDDSFNTAGCARWVWWCIRCTSGQKIKMRRWSHIDVMGRCAHLVQAHRYAYDVADWTICWSISCYVLILWFPCAFLSGFYVFCILSSLFIVLTFNVKCSQKVNVGRRIKAVFAIYITYPWGEMPSFSYQRLHLRPSIRYVIPVGVLF